MCNTFIMYLLSIFNFISYSETTPNYETNTFSIRTIASSTRRYIKSSKAKNTTAIFKYGRCELDSHADSIVAGGNCVILSYTGKVCDVAPYRDDYDTIDNVPIVNAATAWQSPNSGQIYILIFNEAIWMGDNMNLTLLNPNQLRHHGVRVQDDPTSPYPLSIVTEDNEFCMELAMAGTIVYFESHSPTENDLRVYPHIVLTSPHSWDPKRVTFPKCTHTLGEMLGDHSRQLSALRQHEALHDDNESDVLFSLDKLQLQIASLSQVTSKPTKSISSTALLKRDEKIDPGKTDAPGLHTFQSSDRHTDVTPQQLSERWGISVNTASKTLKNTTQKFLRSAILPLSRRYFTRCTTALTCSSLGSEQKRAH